MGCGMRKIALVMVLLSFGAMIGCAEIARPTAQVTSSMGPDIQEATLEPYDGPKARLAVSSFTVKAAKAYGAIGDGLADMLATSLFQTNRYVVLERQALAHVLAEQDLGASGRVRPETGARIGEIEGAELLVMGTVTEFEPGSAGAAAGVGASVGGTVGGVMGWPGYVIGSVLGTAAGSIQTSHVAIDLRIVDTRTSRIVAATSVEGKATDIAGLGALAGPDLGVGLSGYAKTPMEKAVRLAIQKAVGFVVSKTPAQYYRHVDVQKAAPLPAATPATKEGTQPAVQEVSAPTGATPETPQMPTKAPTIAATSPAPSLMAPPASETTPILYVRTQYANLREGADTSARVVGLLKKGMKLTLLGESGEWYRVKLEDGKEGWVLRSVTSLQPQQ